MYFYYSYLDNTTDTQTEPTANIKPKGNGKKHMPTVKKPKHTTPGKLNIFLREDLSYWMYDLLVYILRIEYLFYCIDIKALFFSMIPNKKDSVPTA